MGSDRETKLAPGINHERSWFAQVLRGLGHGAGLLAVFILVCICSFALGPNSRPVGKAKSDLATLRGAIDQFRLDCDRYPTVAEVPQALIIQPSKTPGWHGRYLPEDFGLDPWGHPYHYERSYEGGYTIESFGADGKPGGTGDNADIIDGAD